MTMASPTFTAAFLIISLLQSVVPVGSELSRCLSPGPGIIPSTIGNLLGWGFRGGGKLDEIVGTPEPGYCTCQFQVGPSLIPPKPLSSCPSRFVNCFCL